MKKEKGIYLEQNMLFLLREHAGYSCKEVTDKLGISISKFKEIEEGKKPIKISFIIRLSDIYDLPLIAFFDNKMVKYPDELTDYRINRNKKINPEVKKAERRAYYLIDVMKNLSNGRSNIPKFPEDFSVSTLARKFREKIDLKLPKNVSPSQALEIYKKQLEDALGIIIIESPLKNADVRAFSISSELSIIVLNESDKPEIKTFSLFHEICHLIKRNSAICSIKLDKQAKNEIESYCDKFASEILVPIEEVKKEMKISGPSQKIVNKMSKKYFVSKQVIMLKLLFNDLIDNKTYSLFKKNFDETLLKKKKGGIRDWNKTYFKRSGNKVIQIVREAHRKEKISTADALDILEIKSNYAETFLGEEGVISSKNFSIN